MTDVQIRPSEPELVEDEPPVAHVVKKDAWGEGYIEGRPIVALCGIEFIPQHNPEGLEVCQQCLHILQSINRAEDN